MFNFMLRLQQRRLPFFAIAVALAALIAYFVGLRLSAFEKEVFERLMLAFGETEAGLKQALNPLGVEFQPQIRLLFAVGWAAAGVGLSFKLPAVYRTIAWLQAFVVCLVIERALFSLLKIPTHPITAVSALTLGYLGGYILRVRSRLRMRQESQYYELLLRNRELREMRLQMVKQDEVERRLLAADLHDQVLNDLKQLRLKFDSFVIEPEKQRKDDIDGLLTNAMKEIREVMDSLCPSALEHLGLNAAIEDCTRRGGERGGFKTRFRGRIEDDDADKLSIVEQSLLYRLIQESITNVCKHARASVVRVGMEKESETVVVRIADDGVGIEPEKLDMESRGLRYMRQRADLIGATIAWRNGDNGKGTVVEIRLDLTGRSNAENSDS